MSFFEVYNDKIIDLLGVEKSSCDPGTVLPVNRSYLRTGSNVKETLLRDAQHGINLIRRGLGKRST